MDGGLIDPQRLRRLPLARSVLEESQRASWQLIWREEMQPRLASANKTEKHPDVCQVVQIAAQAERDQQTPAEASAKTDIPIEPMGRFAHH